MRQMITMLEKDGRRREISADVEGGLAIHAAPDYRGYYAMTHVPTGLRIFTGNFAFLLKRARAAMLAALPAGAWEREDVASVPEAGAVVKAWTGNASTDAAGTPRMVKEYHV